MEFRHHGHMVKCTENGLFLWTFVRGRDEQSVEQYGIVRRGACSIFRRHPVLGAAFTAACRHDTDFVHLLRGGRVTAASGYLLLLKRCSKCACSSTPYPTAVRSAFADLPFGRSTCGPLGPSDGVDDLVKIIMIIMRLCLPDAYLVERLGYSEKMQPASSSISGPWPCGYPPRLST